MVGWGPVPNWSMTIDFAGGAHCPISAAFERAIVSGLSPRRHSLPSNSTRIRITARVALASMSQPSD